MYYVDRYEDRELHHYWFATALTFFYMEGAANTVAEQLSVLNICDRKTDGKQRHCNYDFCRFEQIIVLVIKTSLLFLVATKTVYGHKNLEENCRSSFKRSIRKQSFFSDFTTCGNYIILNTTLLLT